MFASPVPLVVFVESGHFRFWLSLKELGGGGVMNTGLMAIRW